jgi:phage shock protein PspC (stress-responsive transcriptional regulator)
MHLETKIGIISQADLRTANHAFAERSRAMKKLLRSVLGLSAAIGAGIPGLAWASGEAASNLVVVADTRRVSGILKYIANVYNTDPWLFAVWAVVITAVWGGILGLLMDFIMERTGLDLKSRKIIEH